MHVLDDPVGRALAEGGPQAAVADRLGAAARYEPSMAPFAAVADTSDPAGWDDLRALVGPGHVAALIPDPPAPPRGWTETFRVTCLQMVSSVAPPPGAGAAFHMVALTSDHVAEMFDLIERSRPGPFSARTVELGGYLGVRDGAGRLVAMAGERMRPPGHTEISAVTTDPAHRGQGLAAGLVTDLVRRIRARGEIPFLHVAEDNTNAIRLYQTLGFLTRRRMDVVGLRAPA